VGAVRRGLGLVLVALLLAAPAAHAAARQESIFEDDDMLLHSSASTVDSTMAELKHLGVDRVRLPALWRNLAPDRKPSDGSDPGAFSDAAFMPLDRAVASAYAHGLSVLLNVRGGAPDWAEGSDKPHSAALRGDAWKPSARAFKAFVTMLGRRYDGTYVDAEGATLPAVDAWSLWNEPNWGGLLQPQSVNGHAYSPGLYRRLYRAGSAALRSTGHGANVILIGETAPLGSNSSGPTHALYAARFYRSLFCLTPALEPRRRCGGFGAKGPLLATGVAHHPYPVTDPPEKASPERGAIRLADAGRLERIFDAARHYHRVGGKLPLWYTEFGYQTNPPDPYRGVSLARQAAWDVRAEYMAYSDRRVLSFDQFLLDDSPPQAQYASTDHHYWSTYQTGLRFSDGKPKPALAAYRLPFLALSRLRPGHPLNLWGMVRPGDNGADQTIRLEHRGSRKAAWQPVATRRVTDPHGYFVERLRFARAGQYRFVWDGVASRPAVTR
jgi:hypothetical protein